MAAENIDLDINLPGEEFAKQAKRMQDELKKVGGVAFDVQKSLKFSISGAVGEFGKMRISASAAASSLKQGVSEADKWAKDFAKMWGRVGMQSFKDAGKEAKKQHDEFARMWGKIGMQHYKDSTKKAQAGISASGIAFAEAIKDAAETFVRTVVNGLRGLAVDAARTIAQQQNLNLGYALTLGPEAGRAMQKDVERFAPSTPYTQQELSPRFLALQRAGYNGRESRNLLALGGDIAARSGAPVDAANLDPIVEFAKLSKAREGFTRRQLDPLLANIGAGGDINETETDFYKQLAGKLGVDEKTARKLAAKGGDKRVSQAGLDTLLTMGEQANKAQGLSPHVGSAMNEEAQGLEATWKRIVNLPTDFYTALSHDDTVDSVAKSLQRIFDTLNPKSERGSEILAELRKQLSQAASWIQKTFTAENIKKFGEGIKDVVKAIGFLVSNAGTMYTVFKDLGILISAMKFSNFIKDTAGANSMLGVMGSTVGLLTADFLIWYDAVKKINDAIKELGGLKRVWQDAKDFFGGHSAGVGGEGVSKGGLGAPKTKVVFDTPEAAADYKSEGTRQTTPFNIPEGDQFIGVPPPAIPKGTTGTTVNQHNEINVTGAPGDDQNHTAQVIGRTVKDQTLRGLEQARQQTGN